MISLMLPVPIIQKFLFEKKLSGYIRLWLTKFDSYLVSWRVCRQKKKQTKKASPFSFLQSNLSKKLYSRKTFYWEVFIFVADNQSPLNIVSPQIHSFTVPQCQVFRLPSSRSDVRKRTEKNKVAEGFNVAML